MFANGYWAIGEVNFYGTQSEDMALRQAKLVGASHVLLGSTYERTVSGSRTDSTPSTTTATVNGQTVNVRTETTTVAPYSFDVYQEFATFFAPLRRNVVGLMLADLSIDQQRQYGTNKGTLVLSVWKGSPSYNADIVPGDVIVSLNGERIVDSKDFIDRIGWPGGEVTVLRDKQLVPLTLVIPKGDW